MESAIDPLADPLVVNARDVKASATNGEQQEPAAGEVSPEQAESATVAGALATSESTPGSTLLREFEQLVGCRAVAYFARSQMDRNDATPLSGLLETMGHQPKIAVIMQSPGGNADSAHLLFNLIREWADEVDVYVASYAASAATLFALGADVLWMGPSSELSPIDPQVPIDPRLLIPTMAPIESLPDEPFFVPAHVIRDFLEWAGITEPSRPRPNVNIDRLDKLLQPLNPWLLGWYERADNVSRVYAKEALTLHLLKAYEDKDDRADVIVSTLLDHYASHEAGITRGEARRIGIPVRDCPSAVWTQLKKIADFYQGAIWHQGLGRLLETTDGFQVTPLSPQRQCPHCQEAVEANDDFRFCPACGKTMYEVCLSCQQPVRVGWKFCPKCGEARPVATPKVSTTN